MPSIFEGLNAVPVERKKSSIFEGLDARPMDNVPISEPSAQNFPPQMLQEQPNEESYMDFLLNIPQRTAGAFTEGLAQSANQMVAAPLLNLAGGATQGIGYLGGQISPEFQQGAENLAQKAYQARDYYQQPVEVFGNAPEDTLANISKNTGEMFLPIPGGATVKGTQAATKAFPHLAKDIGQAVGGGTVLETLKEVPVTGVQGIDDLLKSVAGMALANKAMAPRNAKMVKALDTTVSEATQARPIIEAALGKALSIGAKPNKALLDAAKKEGVELPFNVKLGSRWGDFFANNVFKSMFVSKAYKDVMNNAHKGMFDAFENNVNKIHPEYIEKDVASQRYKEALQGEQEVVRSEVSKLYDDAAKSLTEHDKIVPHHTLETLDAIKNKFNVPAPSEPMKFVNRRINKLLEEWSTSSEAMKAMGDLQHNVTPEIYAQIEKKLKTNPRTIPLEKLVKQRSALLNDIDYGDKAQGIRGFIKPIIAAIDKDIMAASNKEFSTKWRAANKYYKNEWADRIKTDIARSVLEGQTPKDAIKYMGSPQEIKELSHILGNIPNKQEVMSGLKKAKFQQLVVDQVTNSDGTLSYANLANTFTKKSSMNPLLRELSGQANEGMQRLAKISQAFVKSGKELVNPSGTALVQSDFNKIGMIMNSILSVGAGSAALAGYVKTAGATLATPYVLSKIVANPRYVDAAVQYALARQQHSFKKAMQYQRRMENIFEKEILAKAPLAVQREE